MSKINKHLKRQIHPNRWFIWTIVIIVISGLSLFFYIVVSDLNLAASVQYSSVNSKISFSSKQLGYSVLYPRGWILERDTDIGSSIVFENPSNNSENITVTKISVNDGKKIKNAFAGQLHDEDQYSKNGANIDLFKVVGKTSSESFNAAIITFVNRSFYVSGDSAYFTAFINNFKSF